MDILENATADYMNWWWKKDPPAWYNLYILHTWIVCLCGSTRFKELFLQVNRDFTKQGVIVLMPGVWEHAGDKVTDKEKEQLDHLHRQKIAMSDAIYVVNPDGYIGESTKKEIEFAKSLNKVTWYLDGGEE